MSEFRWLHLLSEWMWHDAQQETNIARRIVSRSEVTSILVELVVCAWPFWYTVSKSSKKLDTQSSLTFGLKSSC